ncbi:hypothetical protein ACVXG9_23100 [Escherichia coli]
MAYSSHALLQNAAQGEEYPRLISLVSGLRCVRINAYVFSEGNRQSGKFAWNKAAIVNDVKKGTDQVPFALVPEAALARNVGCDAGASIRPTP